MEVLYPNMLRSLSIRPAFVFLLFLYSATSYAQLPLQVLGPAGMEAVQSNYDLSWTFGEPFTFTYPQSFVILTQGYQQPELKVVAIDENESSGIQVYPNPVEQDLTITSAGGGEYTLYSTAGQLLEKGILEPRSLVNMRPYAAANYVLHIQDGKKQHAYSIIKIQ